MNTKKKLIKKKSIYKGGGLWANIHKKRKRIKAGSGERMRTPGSKGAPTDEALKRSQKTGGLRRLYNTGGQYDNNTMSAAGQGNPSTTIIATESNPEILNARIQKFNELKEGEAERNAAAEQELANLKAQGEANIQQAKIDAEGKAEAYTEMGGQTLKQIKEVQPDAFEGIGKKLNKSIENIGNRIAAKKFTKGVLKKTDAMMESAKALQQTDPIAKAAAAERAARLGKQMQAGIDPLKDIGTSGIKAPDLNTAFSKMTAPKDMMGKPIKMGLDLKTPELTKFKPDGSLFGTDGVMGNMSDDALSKMSQTGMQSTIDTSGTILGQAGQKAGEEIAKKSFGQAMGWGSKGMMSTTGVGATGVGTGLAKFATSGAGMGTIASLAGAGVTALSDDKDATTINTGEGIGAGLSGAGMGIGAVSTAGALMGSAVPVVGTLIGAGVGALYGVGKAMFARNKARKAEAKMEQEIKERKTKYNKELGENYAQQKGMMIGAQNRMKRSSGSDQGFAAVARYGGRRLKRITA